MPGLQWQKYSLCCWVLRTGMHIVFRRKKHNNLSAWDVQPMETRTVKTWLCWSIFATPCHGPRCLTQMFVALPWLLFTSPPHCAQDMLCIECIAGAKNTIQFCIASIASKGRAQLCFAPPTRFWKRTGAVQSSGSVQVRPEFKAPRSKSLCNPAEDCIALHKYAILTRLHGGCIGGGVDTIWAADRVRKPSPLVLAKLSWYLEKV